MANYQKPSTEDEFGRNFASIKPPLNDTQAHYESARCLFCYDAPCMNACPTRIDIPLFIRQIHTGNVIGAAKTIFDSNYFGHACGQVCPTEVLCEGACVYNHQHIKPIEIGRLQSFATAQVIRSGQSLYRPGPPNGKKVAVIGAGPSGISCACELRVHGYEVDLYEAKDKPSGLTVHGVAPYKITNEAVLAEIAYLEKQFGFKIHYKKPVSKDDLVKFDQSYDAILIAIGLGATTKLSIPGEDLDGCVGAVEFVEQLRQRHHHTPVGKRVVVLGGGNTAMDAASESARMGAEMVLLAYRRSREEMRAYGFEFDLAHMAGVKSLFNVSPIEIIGSRAVEGVRFVQTRSVHGHLETMPGTEFTERCDMVIKATGQSRHLEFLKSIHGLAWDAHGKIIVDAGHQSANPRYFIAGDIVNGGKEVVNAAAEGKAAARGIHAYLTSRRT